MSAVIMVLDHPWFTTPQDDGAFVLDNVPAGKRTIAAWHERVGEAKTGLDVPAGGERPSSPRSRRWSRDLRRPAPAATRGSAP